MRKVLHDYLKEKENETHAPHPLEHLAHHLVGNIGLVFCKGDLSKIREVILENKVHIYIYYYILQILIIK